MANKGQLRFFLSKGDESEVSAMIRNAFPSTRILDGNVWPTMTPIEADSIADCVQPYAFVCPISNEVKLPIVQLKDGRFQGPTVGPVIQCIRSRTVEGSHALSAGRFAFGVDDERAYGEAIVKFASWLWRTVRARGRALPRLGIVDRETNQLTERDPVGYILGPRAYEWWAEDPTRAFKDAGVSFRPRVE